MSSNKQAGKGGQAKVNDGAKAATDETTASNQEKPVMQSRNQCAKSGWGSKYHFMLSYGLKMHDDDDDDEADQILDGYRKLDYDEQMKKYNQQ